VLSFPCVARTISLGQRFIDAAITRDDKDPEAYRVAALVSFWKKDLERSREEADTALALNPNHSNALVARGNIDLYSGEPAKAIPYYEKAICLDPGQSQWRHFLALAYFVAGAYETAAAIFKERIALTPNTDLFDAIAATWRSARWASSATPPTATSEPRHSRQQRGSRQSQKARQNQR
jgi:adenylate cyclase